MFKNMNHHNLKMTMPAFALAALLPLSSCGGYLDVVPDNVPQFEDLFVSQAKAYNALAACYYGCPADMMEYYPTTLGDDWAIINPEIDGSRIRIPAAAIMRGNQSASNTLFSFWTGHGGVRNGTPTWVYIRNCDMLIQYVDRVPDLSAEMKADWKAQAKFLKAYYMFFLTQFYGPIVIPMSVDPNA